MCMGKSVIFASNRAATLAIGPAMGAVWVAFVGGLVTHANVAEWRYTTDLFVLVA